MAKKGQASNKTKGVSTTTVSDTPNLDSVTDFGALTVDSNIVIEAKLKDERACMKKLIEVADINALISYEKACAIVCKRYETRARLDGENNLMFQKFSAYYADILKELEKRVEQSCLTPGDTR